MRSRSFARQNSVNLRSKFRVTRELIIRTYSIQALISYQNVIWNWFVSPFRRCARKFCRFYLVCLVPDSILFYVCVVNPAKSPAVPVIVGWKMGAILGLLILFYNVFYHCSCVKTLYYSGWNDIPREKMFHEISMSVDYQQYGRLIQIFECRELSAKRDSAAYHNHLDNLRF